MNTFPASRLHELGVELFVACGAPDEEAETVAAHLVEASLMGIDSHGVVRYIWYVKQCLEGGIRPGAPVEVVRDNGQLALVDCGMNFGQVGARRMVEWVRDRALEGGIAFAVSRHCHHVGRLGAYPQALAEAGLFGFAVANSQRHGHFVVPWGGREGRLATNPLAWSAPTLTRDRPILLDMSTSMTPEGKVRTALHAGQTLPAGRVLDADGHPTTDPAAFYGDDDGPPAGAILPFGGDLGYRGFGLGLLVEILGASIAGVELGDGHDIPYINGFSLLAINPATITGEANRFSALTEELKSYITGVPPAPDHDEVVLPGEREFRLLDRRRREGIPLPAETCRLIDAAAEKVNVNHRLTGA
ncbi:MAG: Ldh family oxidoreductase [Candidatus Latescibacteria bacterium]|nr:Ldh family oxidoreductase [Candidatus Latescibacterota bacterium]MDP7448906.1 Ldh family oxidoreductase [Candidatus Latescibacterota bacterium]HJP33108.1 Ldh family oxidoreductase [Candidatus Latescibacterota bacterium]